MAPSTVVPYLLDTNIVLHATRQNSPISEAIDRQFNLRSSPFRPAICEVSVAELLAFAEGWGAPRRNLLEGVIADLLVLPINHRSIHEEWARLRSFAKNKGLAVQHDHNDLWIAATAKIADMTLMSTDVSGFRPLRESQLIRVELIDPKSGSRIH